MHLVTLCFTVRWVINTGERFCLHFYHHVIILRVQVATVRYSVHCMMAHLHFAEVCTHLPSVAVPQMVTMWRHSNVFQTVKPGSRTMKLSHLCIQPRIMFHHSCWDHCQGHWSVTVLGILITESEFELYVDASMLLWWFWSFPTNYTVFIRLATVDTYLDHYHFDSIKRKVAVYVPFLIVTGGHYNLYPVNV